MAISNKQALRLFQLTDDFSIDELNKHYRKLVIIHHPDKNMANELSAHDMMVKINDGYETLLKYLQQKENEAPIIDEEILNWDETQNTISDIENYVALNVEYFISGIWIYYQYGLENSYLRKEGTRRFRYKQSLKWVQVCIKKLMELKAIPDSENSLLFQTVYKFVMLFYANMKSEPMRFGNLKAEQFFNSNNKKFEALMKKSFIQRSLSREDCFVCYSSYLKLHNAISIPQMKREIQLKLSLFDSLMDLLALRNDKGFSIMLS